MSKTRWLMACAALLVACTTTMTIENQSTRTLYEVYFSDRGDECSSHLQSPLPPGERVQVRVGPLEDPKGVYYVIGAADEEGLCWTSTMILTPFEPFTITITEDDFERPSCICDDA